MTWVSLTPSVPQSGANVPFKLRRFSYRAEGGTFDAGETVALNLV